MDLFSKIISIRWSDLDPNFHLRHSAYYDFGAQQRIEILEQFGLTMKLMQQEFYGPIIFREESIFRREIKLNDIITINVRLAKMKPDASRWTIEHEFLNEENKLCATLVVDGSWIDTKLRKLLNPMPQVVANVFNEFPKSKNYVEL